MNKTMGKPKIKLLLIEDNPGDTRLIAEYFKQREGAAFELSHADNLKSGLNMVEQEQIEALLLDLSLPDSQGLETFAEINRKAPHLPIIILSGTADEEMALRAVRDGAQDYFVKGQIEPNVL